jgi:hypothetical protein
MDVIDFKCPHCNSEINWELIHKYSQGRIGSITTEKKIKANKAHGFQKGHSGKKNKGAI